MQEPGGISRVPKDVGGLLAMDRQTFKSLFYVLSGKPDSKARAFQRKVQLKPADLYDLNRRVQEKLRLHNIVECVAKVTLRQGKNTAIEFGIWKEFQDFDWQRSTTTQEVTIRWDFLLDLDDYPIPQRHTLVVRIASVPAPQALFRVVLSSRSDDSDDPDNGVPFQVAPCVARVDFISHRLADELIDVVSEWNKCVPETDDLSPLLSKLSPYDHWIARATHYSVPILFAIASWMYFSQVSSAWTASEPSTTTAIRFVANWAFFAALLTYGGSILGSILASRAFSALNEYGRFSPFQLTSGDAQRLGRYSKDNAKILRRFVTSVASTLVLDVASAALIAWMSGWLTSQ